MQGEYFRIQDIGLTFGSANNRRGDNTGRTFLGKKDRHVIGRCGFNAIVEKHI